MNDGLLSPWYQRAVAKSRADLDRRGLLAPPDPRTIEGAVQQQFGLLANADRPMMWPSPDREVGGGVDWSSWTAPEWMYEGAKAVALPGHVQRGGDWSPEDVTNMALAVGGSAGASSMAGGVPRGALASHAIRTTLNRQSDLPRGAAPLLAGRTDEEVAHMLNVAEIHDVLSGLSPRTSGPKSDDFWFPGANTKMSTAYPEIEDGLQHSPRDNYEAQARNISWDDQQGKTIIPLVGDRTGTGSISRFGGEDIDPVELFGGKNYMRGADNGAWASEANALKPIAKAASKLDSPMGVYVPMAGTGSDFAHMTTDMLSRVWSPKQLSEDGVNLVNSKIRAGLGVDY